MLTGAQQKVFQRIKRLAWTEHCRRAQIDQANRIALEQWYRRELLAGTGCYSTKEIRPGDVALFDKLCLHFATLSGDQREIGYWARAEERRLLYKLNEAMRKLNVDRFYVLGIIRQMGMPGRAPEELPADHIRNLIAALNTQDKRRHAHVA